MHDECLQYMLTIDLYGGWVCWGKYKENFPVKPLLRPFKGRPATPHSRCIWPGVAFGTLQLSRGRVPNKSVGTHNLKHRMCINSPHSHKSIYCYCCLQALPLVLPLPLGPAGIPYDPTRAIHGMTLSGFPRGPMRVVLEPV